MFLGVIPWHCLLDFVCLFYVFYEVDSLAGLELGNRLVWLVRLCPLFRARLADVRFLI